VHRKTRSVAIGVLPERSFALIDLPREPHDAAVDLVVTEKIVHAR
jgi:5-formyltetrahydrofolate cyclo-ligase